MLLSLAKITAATVTAVGVTTPCLAFVVPPLSIQTGTKLFGAPVGSLGERNSSGKSAVVVRRSTCWRLKNVGPHQQERGRGDGCRVMMASEGQPGEGKFVKMGGAEDVQSFGPRCILASGLSLAESSAVQSILEDLDEDQQCSTPLVVLTPEIAKKRVGDVLTDATVIGLLQKKKNEVGEASAEGASPVILFSGFSNVELKSFAGRFRSETGVRAAFAKAVPNAMTKSVSRLCGEIGQDHADALAGKLHGSKE
ncbi:unnamed protein product [Scytosiphon promiscuus]